MSVDVTDLDFKQIVLEGSHEKPVLVDFWAEWCGPCRMLGPVLEKLEKEYNGRFLLAKVNTDRSPTSSRQFQVSSIPAVILFHKGEDVDEFMGAMPEAGVRKFLDKNIPDPLVQSLVEEAEKDPIHAAQEIIDSESTGKQAYQIIWNAIRLLLSQATRDSLDQAKRFLHHIPEIGNDFSDARNRLLTLFNKQLSDEYISHIKELLVEGNESKALDYFIDLVEKSSTEEKENAKEAILACFQLLGNSHPLTNKYRKKLSQVLF